MEVQDQLRSGWSQYFCNQHPVEFDKSVNQCLLCSEVKGNSVQLEDSSDPYSSIWTDTEPARFKSCAGRSFAMDARIRLDHLKSGCKSPLPCSAIDGTVYDCSCEKDHEPKEEESALDLVELLDVEDDEQDEERWLYESPRKQGAVEETQSALRWCRHVLDNPSPEMEAACRLLINRLDEKSSSRFYRHPAVFHLSGNNTVCSFVDKSSVNTTQNNSGSLDNNEHESIYTSYRLEDITDVHIMACIQEASLRQDYVSTPAVTSPCRRVDSPAKLPSYSTTTEECVDDFTPGNKAEVSSSSCWQPALLSMRSSSSSASPAAKLSCQSPKLARLHQQVTQYKLLKLAQNRATSADRTGSPVRTSLRSLQAVRNSRSLETDRSNPADPILQPPSGLLSPSAACMSSNVLLHSGKDSSVRVAAMKRLQRSQSLSPCRIPHPAKGYLSDHGRVFASPERPTAVAWARNAPSTQR